jgi:S-adenosylmethionine:tRNA ribosyltransferase-isomerase
MDHRRFRDLPELLRPGDLLVLNDTQVVPARLLGRRERTGGKWQGLFLREAEGGVWELMCQTRGRLTEGERILVDPPDTRFLEETGCLLRLQLIARTPEGHWLAKPERAEETLELLRSFGHVPLPPYIRKGRTAVGDLERYQTVYARQPGAVAAPTAGLHFTPAVFEELKKRGIGWTFVTLHVGPGTFQPIQVEDVTRHKMHSEWCQLTDATVEAIRACKHRGGRVVAVGTTSVRVLESVAASGPLRPCSGETNLYIRPPYEFRVIDALVTNFHLPRSSLLVLVSAFADVRLIRDAYREAIEKGYRFYSYGDAMLIV